MLFESLPPIFCSGLSTLYLNLNINNFLKFKILRVAILKWEVTIFRANSFTLKASKFYACGKLTKYEYYKEL